MGGMNEWQAIETAPKDGTDILVCMFGTAMVVVSFDGDVSEPSHPWLTLDGPSYHLEAPTHWMPLPEPPK
jgi:hypothetical protein